MFTLARAQTEDGEDGEASSDLWPCKNTVTRENVEYYDDGSLAYEHFSYKDCKGEYGLCEEGARYFSYSYYTTGSTAQMTEVIQLVYC